MERSQSSLINFDSTKKVNYANIIIFAAFAQFCAIACSHSPNSASDAESSEALHDAIISLSNEVEAEEAEAISALLISSTKDLANAYRMTSPPRYHNLLVHLKLLDRGLCCHWAEDLRLRVDNLQPQTLSIDWLVTKHGKLLEHNSIVVFAANSTWQQDIVFDPWRASGQPYWVTVVDDKYLWKQHPLSGNWEHLHCIQQ